MKRILLAIFATTLSLFLLVGCFLIPDTPENPDETTGDGDRIYDANHPDDGGSRNPFFAATLPKLGEDAHIDFREDYTIYLNGEYLFGGEENKYNSFYTSDLTGDGKPELCFGMCFGTDVIDKRIVIVDYATKQTIYTKTESGIHDYYLFLRNGTLCVKETEYGKQDAIRTGVLTYQNSEITILWDSEVNATYDRDQPPGPGEPIS